MTETFNARIRVAKVNGSVPKQPSFLHHALHAFSGKRRLKPFIVQMAPWATGINGYPAVKPVERLTGALLADIQSGTF